MKEVAKKKLSQEDQDAKMSVLKDIMKDMDGLMSEELDGKKKMKVSVLSDSKKGLEQGLDQAENIVGSKFGAAPEAGALMNEDDYCDDSEMEPDLDDSALSSDEIDAKIKKLLSLKEQKSVKAPF